MEPNPDVLESLALFFKEITIAWEQATQEQRNRLVTCLFEAVWIKEKKVVAVTPRPEFKPFFDLQYGGMSHGVLHMRPRGDLSSLIQTFSAIPHMIAGRRASVPVLA